MVALVIAAFTEALSLNSGIFILLYVTGVITNTSYFTTNFDNSLVVISLFLASLVIIAKSLENLGLPLMRPQVRDRLPIYPTEEKPENKIIEEHGKK